MLDASWTRHPDRTGQRQHAPRQLRRPLRRAYPGHDGLEIRALFAVASRPEVVSLAGGMPNISGLPLDVVGSASAT